MSDQQQNQQQDLQQNQQRSQQQIQQYQFAQQNIRNIAIIAHVDHGKTTLIDAFLKQCKLFRDNQEEMSQHQILDSNDLEKERGITITAKNTSIPYKGFKINIIDTPGHADFGGEVERTLGMANGCLLIVDAHEGVMPQTKFVLKRALEQGLKIIVVINKIDKKLANPAKTHSQIQDLFLELATDPIQLDFKTFYAIGREGKVFDILPDVKAPEFAQKKADTLILLDEIINSIPAPSGDPNAPLQMQVSSIGFDQHYGRLLIGRVNNGVINVGDNLVSANMSDNTDLVGVSEMTSLSKEKDGKSEKPNIVEKSKVKALQIKIGLEYHELESVSAGDIVAVSGFNDTTIGDTLGFVDTVQPLPSIKISPPSLKIRFEANTSPFLGKEGKYANLKQLQNRLDYEADVNVSLKIEKNSDGSYYVSGRGELHLGILIETLRREGYEFQIRKPEVIVMEKDGIKMEPLEELFIEVPEEFYSVVSQVINERKGNLTSIVNDSGHNKLTYTILTRNLIGLRRHLMTLTKGTAIMNNVFHEYVPMKGTDGVRTKGRLVSSATGETSAYALNMIQERGVLFVRPAEKVYEGMIIGINKYDNDIVVNPLKARESSNTRVAHAVVTEIALKSPIDLTLEYAIGFLAKDEMLEVTPLSLRLRKKYLTSHEQYEAEKRLRRK
ncbi:GTP-binding protein [Candidatus Dojkabacteria bacterium]|nr:GTP-binding protein [Candidatus Dojkabacteria bacterium]